MFQHRKGLAVEIHWNWRCLFEFLQNTNIQVGTASTKWVFQVHHTRNLRDIALESTVHNPDTSDLQNN
jgi:hypothetical protein